MSALSDGTKPVNNFTSQDFQPFYLYWSPNSQTIAFLGSDATTGILGQYLVAASGGESKLISGGQPYYWDWSPDNKTMIVHTGGASSINPNARLTFMGVDGSIPKRDLDVKPGFFDAPAWSPAGDGVALDAQNDAGEDELILAGEDGKVKQVLASQRTGDFCLVAQRHSSGLCLLRHDRIRSNDPPDCAGHHSP